MLKTYSNFGLSNFPHPKKHVSEEEILFLKYFVSLFTFAPQEIVLLQINPLTLNLILEI